MGGSKRNEMSNLKRAYEGDNLASMRGSLRTAGCENAVLQTIVIPEPYKIPVSLPAGSVMVV
jgi:hypothetical protein